jgi:hypothetical protein
MSNALPMHGVIKETDHEEIPPYGTATGSPLRECRNPYVLRVPYGV